MARKASAVWQGSLKEGKGTISSGSGVLAAVQYSFSSRFEEGIGTNPEELIAAAHAGCFAMAISAVLGEAGLTAERIDASAAVTLRFVDEAPTITLIQLAVVATVPGATEEAFLQAAETAKANCPISRLFNTEITLEAKLA